MQTCNESESGGSGRQMKTGGGKRRNGAGRTSRWDAWRAWLNLEPAAARLLRLPSQLMLRK